MVHLQNFPYIIKTQSVEKLFLHAQCGFEKTFMSNWISVTDGKNVNLMPGLHLQRNRRKSAIQKIYDGRGNFNDGCVAGGARLLRRDGRKTSTTVVKLPQPSLNFHDRR